MNGILTFEIGLFINNLPIKTERDGAWVREEEENEKIGDSVGSGLFIGNQSLQGWGRLEKTERLPVRWANALFLFWGARLVYPAGNLFRNYFSVADNSNHFELIMQCRIRKDYVIIAA